MWVVNKKKHLGKYFKGWGIRTPNLNVNPPPTHTHTSVPSSNAHAFLEEKKPYDFVEAINMILRRLNSQQNTT